MKRVGIVGHAQEKFDERGEAWARKTVAEIIELNKPCVVISGACHLGGVDSYAKEYAEKLG